MSDVDRRHVVVIQERSARGRWVEIQQISGVVEQICRARIRIRVRVGGREKVVNVAPENVISEADANE